MGVIGKKCPAVTTGPGFWKQFTQPIQKVLTVFFVPKYLSTLDPTNHDVIKNSSSVKAC